MALELVAIASEDGWAFVKQDDAFLLVRPPYEQSNLSPASERMVEKAINHHGFVAECRHFDSWKELLNFLETRLIEARKALGYPSLGARASEELLRRAPREIVERYLNRIEVELLPRREWTLAFDLLTVLIDASSVAQDPRLTARVHALLRQCRDTKATLESDRLALQAEMPLLSQFTEACKLHGEENLAALARTVSQQGCLFHITSS